MTIGELKAKIPLADVVEIRPEARYILRLPLGCTAEDARGGLEKLKESGMENFVIITGNITIYDIEP